MFAQIIKHSGSFCCSRAGKMAENAPFHVKALDLLNANFFSPYFRLASTA
jgi:hypothetical protein